MGEGYSHIRAIFLVFMLRRKILKSKFTRRANFNSHSIVSSAFETEHFEYLSSPSYNSSGDIHFWIYDDVTKNGVLDLIGKISIRITFSPLLF